MTNETFNYCQYLYVATQNLLRAVTLFNSSGTGDVERAYSALHKSWVLLFQADILMNNNGSIHYCPNEPICNNASHNRRFYGIEKALNEINDHKSAAPRPVLSNGYYFDKGTGLFKILNEKKNLYQNLNIIRELRNVDQHDYFEANPAIFTDLMDATRPYVISNIKNFVETYDDFLILRQTCSSRKVKSRCSCSKILSSEELSSQIYFPLPYNNIFSPSKANETSLSIRYREENIDHCQLQITEREQTIKKLDATLFNLHKQAGKTSSPNETVLNKIKETKEDLAKENNILSKLHIRLSNLENEEYLSEASFNFRHSTVRKEFEKAKKSFGESVENDGRLLINISIDQESLQEESGQSQLFKYVQEYLKKFEYNSISEVRAALSNDSSFAYDISSARIMTYRDDIEFDSENKHEQYFGIYFDEMRYTKKFVDYIKKKYIGLPKKVTQVIPADENPFL